MKLHFLGRGAAFNPLEKSTSAYVKEGDRLFLLDCGESVFAELIRRAQEPKDYFATFDCFEVYEKLTRSSDRQ